MKRYLITGVLIWVPLVMTFFVVRAILQFSDSVLFILPEYLQTQAVLGVHLPGEGLLVIFVILFATGLLFRNVCGEYLVRLTEKLASQIPIVSSVHNGVRQVLRMVFTTNKSFQEVVLVEYPRRDCWSVAFVTNRQPAHGVFTQEILTLFIPTTPNPTSGYVFVVPENEVKYLDLTIDEAVKFVISLGTIDGIGHKIKPTPKKKGDSKNE